MLYERWQRMAQQRRNEVALRDLASGQCWTFGQLDREAQIPLPGDSLVACPQGHSPEFIFTVLRAWRQEVVVCPIESHKQPLTLSHPLPRCCQLKHTPATMGTPRTVAFTEEQLAADAEQIVSTMGLRPDWPNLGVISLAYSYGFSNLVLPLLLHGIPLFLAPSPLPDVLRSADYGRWDLTLAAVPALWRAWHKAGAILHNVRLAISAGAPLALTLERAVFKEHGVKIHNFYGTTECGGIAYDATEVPRADEACVGHPLKNVHVAVSEGGALLVRSRAVGETYWPEPAETLGKGRFQTCDLADLQHGAVYLRGRTGDQINVAGRKVSPDAIEEVLLEHDAVAECLVFGVPSENPDRIDLIVACVTADQRSTTEDLKQFLLQKLPSWQVPREWWFVNSLATNGNEKVSRAHWRGRFLEMKARGGVQAET